MQSVSNFSFRNTIYPYKNTKSDRPFETIIDGNLKLKIDKEYFNIKKYGL